MNKSILFFLLIISLISCKKSSREKPEGPGSHSEKGGTLFQTKISKSTGDIMATRLYNRDGKLYLETTKDGGTGLEMYQQFFYKEGKLYRSDVSNENRKLSKIDYEYQEGRLVKMRFFEFDHYQNAELNFERYFEYRKGVLYKISTKSSDGTEGEFVVFTFVDGNVTGTKTYSSYGQLLNAFRFEYDDKVNPYYLQPDHVQSYLGHSKCNVVKSIYYDFSINGFTQISYFDYDYNFYHQPVTSYLLPYSGIKRKVVEFEYK